MVVEAVKGERVNDSGDAVRLASPNSINDQFIKGVELAGAGHQRISYSDLMHCGLEELCTFSPADYVEKAVSLAGDREKLLAWRHGLRDIMEASPLRDKERFVHEFQNMLEQVANLHGLRGHSLAGEVEASR